MTEGFIFRDAQDDASLAWANSRNLASTCRLGIDLRQTTSETNNLKTMDDLSKSRTSAFPARVAFIKITEVCHVLCGSVGAVALCAQLRVAAAKEKFGIAVPWHTTAFNKKRFGIVR